MEIIGIIAFIWAVYKYIDTKKREQDLKEFDNYHELIKGLVQPEKNIGLYVDRQTAIMYELTKFKRYYPFSYRTLIGLKEKWTTDDQYPRLIEELNLTINFLEKYKNN